MFNSFIDRMEQWQWKHSPWLVTGINIICVAGMVVLLALARAVGHGILGSLLGGLAILCWLCAIIWLQIGMIRERLAVWAALPVTSLSLLTLCGFASACIQIRSVEGLSFSWIVILSVLIWLCHQVMKRIRGRFQKYLDESIPACQSVRQRCYRGVWEAIKLFCWIVEWIWRGWIQEMRDGILWMIRCFEILSQKMREFLF